MIQSQVEAGPWLSAGMRLYRRPGDPNGGVVLIASVILWSLQAADHVDGHPRAFPRIRERQR
jgi:hypothetical protein